MTDATDSTILFSKPGCVQCNATKRWLNERGIDYHYVDVSEDADAHSRVVDLGYLQVPVMLHTTSGVTEHWSGFDVSKLEAHFA